MWIFDGQDLHNLQIAKGVAFTEDGKVTISYADNSRYLLGNYKNERRAEEILEEMMTAMELNRKIYIMPEK